MALVTPDCFLGLPPEDRAQQLYEALFDWTQASGEAPAVAPDCFKGLMPEYREQAVYAALYLQAP